MEGDSKKTKLVRGILAAKGQCPVESSGGMGPGEAGSCRAGEADAEQGPASRSLQQALPSSEPRCRTVAAWNFINKQHMQMATSRFLFLPQVCVAVQDEVLPKAAVCCKLCWVPSAQLAVLLSRQSPAEEQILCFSGLSNVRSRGLCWSRSMCEGELAPALPQSTTAVLTYSCQSWAEGTPRNSSGSSGLRYKG